jgi:hypothetical protein
MSFGWVDLSHILDLYEEKRLPAWFTLKELNQLMSDKENQAIFWQRPEVARDVVKRLRRRQYEQSLYPE